MIEDVQGYLEEVKAKHRKLRRLTKEKHLKYLEEKNAYSIACEEYMQAENNYKIACIHLKEVEDIYEKADQMLQIKKGELSDLEMKGRSSRENIAQVVSEIRILHHEIDELEYEAFLKQNLIGFKRAELNMAEAMMKEKLEQLNQLENGLKHRIKEDFHESVKHLTNAKAQNQKLMHIPMLSNA